MFQPAPTSEEKPNAEFAAVRAVEEEPKVTRVFEPLVTPGAIFSIAFCI
jgi:hypothetical protein